MIWLRGKSTQAKLLAEALEKAGIETLQTREPGGTFGAEAIRDLVLEGTTDRWSGMTELLLMYAARMDHVEKLIKPALERGVWVISDRFADSSLLRKAFLEIARENPARVHTVDADGTRGNVQNRILFTLTKQFPELAGKVGA